MRNNPNKCAGKLIKSSRVDQMMGILQSEKEKDVRRQLKRELAEIKLRKELGEAIEAQKMLNNVEAEEIEVGDKVTAPSYDADDHSRSGRLVGRVTDIDTNSAYIVFDGYEDCDPA